MSDYQICSRCVMDSSANDIIFDENGFCNYCSDFIAILSISQLNSPEVKRAQELDEFVSKVKANGVGKDYDCIVGVSGGVDSSWVLVKAKELGLRPLAVHMDNGWNSEIAVNNISNLIEELEVDLFTYVINWDEYKDLMESFFSADVIDIELLYDNAMTSVCYEQATKYNLKYILSGSNLATEGMRMPLNWAWKDKWDGTNIRSIAKSHRVVIKTFPTFTNFEWLKQRYLRDCNWVPFLDYLEYSKNEALQILEKDFGYKKYPYKHYESVFTRFYQGYILPKKFGVDKRRVHLSTLIITNQMTREEALKDLRGIPYPSERDLELDIQYFLKKMEWSREDLDHYIHRPIRQHDEWQTDRVRKYVWPILSKLGALRKILFSK